MDLDQLKKAITDFFGDTSRSQSETKEGLQEAADLIETFIETLGD